MAAGREQPHCRHLDDPSYCLASPAPPKRPSPVEVTPSLTTFRRHRHDFPATSSPRDARDRRGIAYMPSPSNSGGTLPRTCRLAMGIERLPQHAYTQEVSPWCGRQEPVCGGAAPELSGSGRGEEPPEGNLHLHRAHVHHRQLLVQEHPDDGAGAVEPSDVTPVAGPQEAIRSTQRSNSACFACKVSSSRRAASMSSIAWALAVSASVPGLLRLGGGTGGSPDGPVELLVRLASSACGPNQ